MDDLARWLRAQLDEDERIAEAARQGFWTEVIASGYLGLQVAVGEARHIAVHDPARVLREIDAKRRTLVRCQEEMFCGIPRLVHFAKQTVREMAAVYKDRPGYAEALASFE